MLLLDIDNTIIPSVAAYEYAISQLESEWARKFGTRKKDFRAIYDKSRAITKQDLKGHSSQRLRILYFKKMLEIQNGALSVKRLDEILEMEKRYFRYFLYYISKFKMDHKSEYKAAFSILRKIESKDRLVLISNENLRTQLLKLEAILPKDLRFQLITSEELGIEKPHPKIFQVALEKGGIQSLKPSFIIGDNWEDDIEGGLAAGLSAIHQTQIWGEPDQVETLENGVLRTSNLITSLEILADRKRLDSIDN